MIQWSTPYYKDIGNGREVELLAPLVYRYAFGGRPQVIIVPKGFVTDYSSVPWIFRMGFPCFDRDNNAAVVHDFLCGGDIFPRARCDRVFYEAMISRGMDATKAKLKYLAVRIGGLFPADSARSVCQVRKLAGLYSGDPTAVDPVTVPRPLWADGCSQQQEAVCNS